MTANSAGSPHSMFDSLIAAFRHALRLISKLAIGGLAIIAAGVVALTAAFLGLLIALAAVIFRFSPRRSKMKVTRERGHDASDASIVLEARQTGQGWTVE